MVAGPLSAGRRARCAARERGRFPHIGIASVHCLAALFASLALTGSSLAVTLPNEVVEDFKVKKGQEVDVTVHPITGAVTIRAGVKYFEGGKVNMFQP